MHYVANRGLGGGGQEFVLKQPFLTPKVMDLGSLYKCTSRSKGVHLCTRLQESGTVLFLSTNQKPAFGHHKGRFLSPAGMGKDVRTPVDLDVHLYNKEPRSIPFW